ncbi:MAG: PKD domain-containing protein, partial [Actinobacteria bacterium]|nr:PKD domain-containing protein [Actinomycetota bacterium]
LQAVAAQCLTRTCVDVYIENGQIVIEGHKGSGKKSTAQVKKRVLQPEKIAPLPKPRATTTRRSPAGAVVRRAVPRKKILRKITRRVAPAISLSDKLVKLLPTASIARQPDQGALVNVPVIYWSDLPTVFTTRVSIVGEIVDVTMRPSFLWSFGDGTFFATTEAGRPYPEENITHIYSRAGTYLVTMLATWGGTWSHNGVARAITGQIRKLSVATLSVANGPTRITK